ncbi:MAG: hypothetical protein ACFCBU_09845 [Cyanophyceae cyanobacterium]
MSIRSPRKSPVLIWCAWATGGFFLVWLLRGLGLLTFLPGIVLWVLLGVAIALAVIAISGVGRRRW